MKRNCQLCSKEFSITKLSSNVLNCDEHKGFFIKNHKFENNKILRKCSRCNTFKDLDQFYKKDKAKGSSFCIHCFSSNSYKYQKDKGLSRKITLIKARGGCCTLCKYNKNISALEFHHLDPSKKDFNLDSRRIANNSIEVINKELDKCILICSNCHREIHHPDMNNLL